MNAMLEHLDAYRYRMTYDQVMRLVNQGFFEDPSRIELIDGVIALMPAEGYAHTSFKAALNKWLVMHAPDGFMCFPDSTLVLSPTYAPSPDLRLQPTGIAPQDIQGADIPLIIEIADSSLQQDRDAKAPLYAEHGVQEYWIVDIETQSVLQFLPGEAGTYLPAKICATDEAVKCASIEGLVLKLSDLELAG